MKSINRVVLFIATLMVFTFCAEGKQNCDKLGINFYDNIGCARQNSEGDCPSYNDCKYERQPGTCLLNGVVYIHREEINNENDMLCNNYCSCEARDNAKGLFVCPADGSCGDWINPVKEGCYFEYNLTDCCGNQRCGYTSLSRSIKILRVLTGDLYTAIMIAFFPQISIYQSEVSCVVDGVTYKEGQRIYPKDECVVCICTSEFNGKYDGPNCTRRGCDIEMRHADKIESNCAPTYCEDPNAALCCPETFICPSDEDKFTGSADTNSTLTCKYGSKTVKPGVRLTSRSEDELSRKNNVTCECKLPPLLTCTTLS